MSIATASDDVLIEEDGKFIPLSAVATWGRREAGTDVLYVNVLVPVQGELIELLNVRLEGDLLPGLLREIAQVVERYGGPPLKRQAGRKVAALARRK